MNDSPSSDFQSIDIVICTYNNATLLDRTLGAIANQIVSPSIKWQVLVVNNNCTDNTEAIVEKHIQSSRVPLRMVKESMQGLTPARLCGVKNTTAEWIAFVDDDCLLERDWIEQAVKFILAHPASGAFGGRVILEWETPPPPFVLNYAYAFAQQEHGELPKRVTCLAGAGIVVRRSALARCGWIDRQFLADRIGNKLISGGDVEIALRLASKYDIWYDPACRLTHIIPARRTTPQYLKAINYGLGRSKLFGDTMLWSSSYSRWFFASLVYAVHSLFALSSSALRVLAGRKPAIELAIDFNFLCGWLAGIWQLRQMDSWEREQLLGCAKVGTSS